MNKQWLVMTIAAAFIGAVMHVTLNRLVNKVFGS